MSVTSAGPATVLAHQLANGLRLFIKRDTRAPLVSYCLTVDVGSANETPGRTGFAHLFEHLMFQGSQQVAPDEMAQTLTKLGGVPNAMTNFDRTMYFCQLPKNAWRLGLWFEADRLADMTAALDQRTLDRERNVVKNERREKVDNQPYGDAFEHLFAAAFPEGHPYHVMPIGKMEDIDAANLEDVKAFFGLHYGPNNAVLAVVGDIDPDEVIATVEEYFGPIAPLESLPPRPVVAADPMPESIRIFSEASVPAAGAFSMYRGPGVDTADFAALQVACHILSGGPTSRLTKALTMDDDVCFEAGVQLEASFDGLSVASAYGICFPDRTPDEYLQILDAEFAKLASSAPSDIELQGAKASVVRQLSESVDGIDGQAEAICDSVIAVGHPDLTSQRIAAVQALTGEDISRACAHWLCQGRAEVIYPTGEMR